jgi:hypothetical protein
MASATKRRRCSVDEISDMKEDAKEAAKDSGMKKTDNEHGHLKVTAVQWSAIPVSSDQQNGTMLGRETPRPASITKGRQVRGDLGKVSSKVPCSIGKTDRLLVATQWLLKS